MEDIINILNNGNDSEINSLRSYFGDNLIPLFKMLYKRNLIHLLDLHNPNPYWIEDYISTFVDLDKEFLKPLIEYYFDDITIIGENEIYVNVWDLESFSKSIFKDSRYCLSPEYASHILMGEETEYFDLGYNLIDGIMEAITHLDPSNTEYLKTVILKKIEGQKIKPLTELLESISEEQQQDFVKVNEKNINRIFRDSETLQVLFEYYLKDIGDDIYRLYENCYSSAVNDANYENVISSLSVLFTDMEHIDEGKRVSYRFKVVDFFYWFEKFNEYDLSYHRNFVSCLGDYISGVCVKYGDYPNYHSLESLLNDYFQSEIN